MTKNRVIWFVLLAIGLILVEENRIAAMKQEAAADHAKMSQTLIDSNQQQIALCDSRVKLANIHKQQEMAMAYAEGRAQEHLHRPFDSQFRYILDHPYTPEGQPPAH